MKAFFLFCALLGSFFMANAQTTKFTDKNVATALPPKEFKAINGPTDVTNGVYKSKEYGISIKWAVAYNAKEKKISFITFEQSGELSSEIFNGGIQAMTAGQFWGGVAACMGSNANNCIASLMVQALQDCAAVRGTSAEPTHCWMH